LEAQVARGRRARQDKPAPRDVGAVGTERRR